MACRFIFRSVGEQQLEVGCALLRAIHRLDKGRVTGFFIDTAQERFSRQRGAQPPQEGELRKEGGAFLVALLCCLRQAAVERHVPLCFHRAAASSGVNP